MQLYTFQSEISVVNVHANHNNRINVIIAIYLRITNNPSKLQTENKQSFILIGFSNVEIICFNHTWSGNYKTQCTKNQEQKPRLNINVHFRKSFSLVSYMNSKNKFVNQVTTVKTKQPVAVVVKSLPY